MSHSPWTLLWMALPLSLLTSAGSRPVHWIALSFRLQPPSRPPVETSRPAEPPAPTLDTEEVPTLFAHARRRFYDPARPEDLTKAQEQLQDLETRLSAAIAANPHDSYALYWLGQVQYTLGELWEAQGDKQRARQYFEACWTSARRAVELDESLSDAHRLVGDAIGRLIAYRGWRFAASNGSKAHAAIERALQLDDQNAMAHLTLGYRYLFTPRLFGGDPGKAVEAFRRALGSARDEHERFLAHLGLGQALLKRKEYEEAREHLQKAVTIYPHNGRARSLLESLQGYGRRTRVPGIGSLVPGTWKPVSGTHAGCLHEARGIGQSPPLSESRLSARACSGPKTNLTDSWPNLA